MGPRRQVVSPLAVALALVATIACDLSAISPPADDRVEVTALGVDLDPKAPQKKQAGKLLFLNGFELKSSDRRFGGLSGLSVNEASLLALSDRGYWISARIDHDSDGRLIAFSDWHIERLLTLNGQPVSRRLADSEGLSQDQDGSFIVSFEQVHRLWRYAPPPATIHSTPIAIPVPTELARAPANEGVECVAVLGNGRPVIIAENFRNTDGSLAGWILGGGGFRPLSYLPSEDFTPSDCAALKNGDLLLMERQIGLLGRWATRIKKIPRDNIRPGARLEGTEIARLALPQSVDNFEGMAVYEHPKAGTLVYLVSDDNYLALQRTLLLQFRLTQ
jgi:hypothetical protein